MSFDRDFAVKKKKEIHFKVKNGGEYKEIDATNRTVKLVANTLNFFDYDGDVLLPGCANRSIKDRGAKSETPAKIAHLLHHDMNRAVGKSLLESEESINGRKVLYCESYLPETIEGDDTITKYEVGMYNQHSVGFKYIDISFIAKGEQGWDKMLATLVNPEDADAIGYAYAVKEIMWWEYSTVTFGANMLTEYLGTKSKNKFDIVDVITKKLSILATKAMRREIKDKKAFEFEVSQLQQMILELSEIGPSEEDIRKRLATEDTQKKIVKLSGFSNNLKF